MADPAKNPRTSKSDATGNSVEGGAAAGSTAANSGDDAGSAPANPVTEIAAIGSQKTPAWALRSILWFWFSGAAIWVGYQVYQSLRSLLVQIVLALFFSFALEPLVDRLNSRGMSRGIATGITMLTALLLTMGFLTAMGSLIANQLNALVEDLPGYAESGQAWLESSFNLTIEDELLLDQIQAEGRASQYVSSVANSLLQAGSSALGVMLQILTVSLFTFYFTADGPKFRSSLCSMLPPARQHEVLRVWDLAIAKTGAFLASRFILAVTSAAFHWLVFALMGLPSALAIALWVGLISQFVPVIGTYIGGVLPALIALGIDPIKAVWVIAAVVSYQQIENYLLQPRITAHTLKMHPAIAFGAVLAGAAIFGVSGALLALPFMATLQSFLTVYIERHETVQNSLLVKVAQSNADRDTEITDGGKKIDKTRASSRLWGSIVKRFERKPSRGDPD